MRGEELVAILDRVLFSQDFTLTVGDHEVAGNITDALFRIGNGLHRLAAGFEGLPVIPTRERQACRSQSPRRRRWRS
jgi:hypothetical protein